MLATAHATPLHLTSFEAVDDASGTARDQYEWTVTEPSGDATVLACNQSSTCAVSNDQNGGSATSKWGVSATVGSSQTGWVESPTVSLSKLTIGFALAVQSAPGSARVVASIREGSNDGVVLRLNTDRTLSLFYRATSGGTSINFGATAAKVQPSYCTGTSCSTDSDCADAGKGLCIAGTCHSTTRPCTTGTQSTDCPSGQTCATCNTTTGNGCYAAHVEMVEIGQGSSVIGELWIDGQKLITTAPQVATPGTITAARLGILDSQSGTARVEFDDVVLDDSDRAGWGYIARRCPATDGSPIAWDRNSCTGATQDVDCVDDYCAGSFVYDGADLSRATANKEQVVTAYTPALTLGALAVPAVESVLIGRTSTSTGTRQLAHVPMVCLAGTCSATAATTFAPAASTTNRVLHRYLLTTAPGPIVSAWDAASVNGFGVRWMNTVNNAALNNIVGAALQYVYARRADTPLRANLLDHNVGVKSCAVATDCCAAGCACEAGKCTKDGRRSIGALGDSTAGATFAVTCLGGTNAGAACSQVDYCSWDVSHDKPSGGCSGVNAQCQTCTSRRGDFNGGAGYACGPNNGNASCSLGTCSGNVCTGDTDVSCATNADCNLGTCDVCTNADCSGQSPASACVTSCPGGSCPNSRAAWPNFLKEYVGADVIYRCSQGAETTEQMYANRFLPVLQGTHVTCTALVGTGQCTCTSNAECGSGGTCNVDGQCTAGDAGRTACVDTTTCASGRACRFAPADVLVTLEGYNDAMTIAGASPSCTGLRSVLPMDDGQFCDNCPRLHCDATSECAARSSGSQCLVGESKNFPSQFPCTFDRAAFTGQCTVQISACRVSADCPSGQTCSGGSASDVTAEGHCTCGADSDPGNCPTGYACRASICRLKCTADSQCGSGGVCATSTPRTCKPRCTCPCDSTDMTAFPSAGACTADSQCPTWVDTSGSLDVPMGGRCVSSKCRCCGRTIDPNDAQCGSDFFKWSATHAHRTALDVFTAMQATVNGFAVTHKPLLAFLTLNDPNQDQFSMDSDVITRPDFSYYRKTNAHLLYGAGTTFRHVIDAARAVHAVPPAECFPDNVHHKPRCGLAIGQAAGEYIAALNRCAKSPNSSTVAMQRYCTNADGTFPSGDPICTTITDCAAGKSCLPRACASGTDCPHAGDGCHLE